MCVCVCVIGGSVCGWVCGIKVRFRTNTFYLICYSKSLVFNFEIQGETRGYGYFKTCRLDLSRTEFVQKTFGTPEFLSEFLNVFYTKFYFLCFAFVCVRFLFRRTAPCITPWRANTHLGPSSPPVSQSYHSNHSAMYSVRRLDLTEL